MWRDARKGGRYLRGPSGLCAVILLVNHLQAPGVSLPGYYCVPRLHSIDQHQHLARDR